MSDETSRTSEPEATAADDEAKREGGEVAGSGEGGEAAGSGEGGEAEAAPEEPPKERLDEDGLPIDRDPTIDDVRSTEARHGRIAFGCTLFVVLLLVLFWLVRGGIIG